MDVKKVTVFIGNQGSGKSTVAKLISSFSWIEKALNGLYEKTNLEILIAPIIGLKIIFLTFTEMILLNLNM